MKYIPILLLVSGCASSTCFKQTDLAHSYIEGACDMIEQAAKINNYPSIHERCKETLQNQFKAKHLL